MENLTQSLVFVGEAPLPGAVGGVTAENVFLFQQLDIVEWVGFSLPLLLATFIFLSQMSVAIKERRGDPELQRYFTCALGFSHEGFLRVSILVSHARATLALATLLATYLRPKGMAVAVLTYVQLLWVLCRHWVHFTSADFQELEAFLSQLGEVGVILAAVYVATHPGHILLWNALIRLTVCVLLVVSVYIVALHQVLRLKLL